MTNKYLSFSPYYSGLSNVIMSYELAFAIAHITKRTLILPPDAFMLFISGYHRPKFVDIWQVFDKEVARQEFDVIEYKDVPEYQGKFDKIVTDTSYTGNIADHISDLYAYPKKINGSAHIAMANDLPNIKDSYDFNYFLSGREVVDLNRPEKFLHFQNNLFNWYWYTVYPGNKEQRNILKDKVNKTFRYKQKYFDLAQQVKNKIGPFNAIHVRRNDFFVQYSNGLESVNTETKLVDAIDKIAKLKNLPLYISTDEPNKDFFKEVRKKYNIYFYQDFDYNNLSDFENTIMEQVICSQAESFFGTYLSTYTKRINGIRGLEGRQSDDYMGINSIVPKPFECDFPLPWTMRTSKTWSWNDSCHPQWMKE